MRDRVTVLAPAKLNLALDVVGILPGGYHALDMTMQAISLYERVVIRRRPDGGLLGGLYEFPHILGHPGEGGVAEHLSSLGLSPGGITPLGPARHLFTHVEWQMEGYAVRLPRDSILPEGWLAVRCGEIRTDYAIPAAFAAYRSVLFPNTARRGRRKEKTVKRDKSEKFPE